MLYTPDMVLGPARKGIKLTYTTDTRPVKSIEEHAKDSDYLSVKECMESRIKKRKRQRHINT